MPVGDIARLLNEQLERFSEHLRRNRRGKQHKRTSKSLRLTLLEYYLYIIQFAADASGRAASHVRRQTQISDTWTAVKHNRWFPRQGEPVLLRAEDSDLESEYAETVYPRQDQSEEEEEEDSQWRPPEPDPSPPRRPREPDHPPPGSSSSSRVVPRASSVVVPDLRAVPKAKAAS